MIISKEVEVTLGNNVKYWEDKGYEIIRTKNKFGRIVFKKGTKIKVKVVDLPPKSNVKIWCKCDECGREKEVEFLDYHDLCTGCYNKTEEHRKRVSKTLTGKYNGEDSPSWTGGLPKCEDCGVLLGNRKAKVCVICFGKRNRGENNVHWKPKSVCLDCGKILSKRKHKYCKDCYGQHQSGENHQNWNFNKTEFRKYWTIVWRETRKYKKELFENWDGTDYYTGEILIVDIKKCKEKSYRTIDHKMSINYGYNNNINPNEIGKLENLCVCSRSNNSKKHNLLENEFISIINKNKV